MYCNFLFHIYFFYKNWYRGFEMRLICTVKCKLQKCIYVDYKNAHKLHFSMKGSLKHKLVVSFLFLPLLPLSNPPYLHYFMPFRNISCRTFTIWCNKNNQHFTVTDTHSFCYSTNSHWAILFAAILLFPYSTYYGFSRFLVTPLLGPTPHRVSFYII